MSSNFSLLKHVNKTIPGVPSWAIKAHILILCREYDDYRQSAANVFLKVVQILYKLPLNAQVFDAVVSKLII